MTTHRSIASAFSALLFGSAAFAQDAPPVRPPPPAPSGEVAPDSVQPGGEVSKQVFVERLTPHGRWVETPEYGRVFVPNVDSGWRPYTYGRWVYTDWGWTWASDEPFGWATYHYGRWYNGPSFGWYWIPGRRWAPAWVSWRWSAGYVAWVPLAPRRVVGWGVSSPYWVAVRSQQFTSPVRAVALAPQATAGVIAQTRPLGGAFGRPNAGLYGPPVGQISAATGQRIAPIAAGRVVAGARTHASSGYSRATPRREARAPGTPKASPPPGRWRGRAKRWR